MRGPDEALTIDEWVRRDAFSFNADAPSKLHEAVDWLITWLGPSLEVLGLGEPMHGADDLLLLRNRVFGRLVDSHGFTAFAIESSFPRGRRLNDYVSGTADTTLDHACEQGFSHQFGESQANRELIQWMRSYNADPPHGIKLHFHGFDSPTEMTGTDSPRQLLMSALEFLASIDLASGGARRARIDRLLGSDADWENPAAVMDPSKSIGLSPAAVALRVETEELITELQCRRPELVARSDAQRFLEAERHATLGRQMLSYHAALARPSPTRVVELLGLRDRMMADNLAHILECERRRAGGRVLVFAHNSHLRRGQARWQLGPHALAWWTAGAQLDGMIGSRYAVVGTGVGVSASNGIGQPEPGTLEARLTAAPGPARLIPTHRATGFADLELQNLPVRSTVSKNSTYFALDAGSLVDFDALAVLDSVA